MDVMLKQQLKDMGLYPLEIDEEAQDRYMEEGIDPFKVERHFTPGTPDSIIAAHGTLEANILELHSLEVGNGDYLRRILLEGRVREDLDYLKHSKMESVLIHQPAMTGVCGYNRDVHSSLDR